MKETNAQIQARCEPPREPLADNEIIDLWDIVDTFVPAYEVIAFARAVLAAQEKK